VALLVQLPRPRLDLGLADLPRLRLDLSIEVAAHRLPLLFADLVRGRVLVAAQESGDGEVQEQLVQGPSLLLQLLVVQVSSSATMRAIRLGSGSSRSSSSSARSLASGVASSPKAIDSSTARRSSLIDDLPVQGCAAAGDLGGQPPVASVVAHVARDSGVIP